MDLSEDIGPKVQRQSLLRLRLPATGVSGQESLSDSEESRLSPARGPLGRGELSSDENAELDDAESDWREGEADTSDADLDLIESRASDESDSDDARLESEDRVDCEDSRSECAMVYLMFVISSSNGVRKETRFSAGNSGRAGAILRGASDWTRLLERIDLRL